MKANDEMRITMAERLIALPGWRLTPTSAAAEGKPDAEAFRNAFRFLHATTGWNAWWWGDVILAYCDFEKKDRDDGAAWVHYANEWEEIVGMSAGTLHAYCQVARAFESTSRLVDLSWSHHHEIVSAGIKDAHEMRDWLSQALANDWSKTTLRAQLRAAKRAADGGDEARPVQVTQQELFAAKRWARAQMPRVEAMEMEELDRMIADLAPLVELAHSLALARKARANGGAAISYASANGGAKESLSAAA